MTEANIYHHGEEGRRDRISFLEIECNCFECKHLHEDQQTCDAYPNGIPSVLLYLDKDHKRPYPGDHGIHFEPIECPYERKGKRRHEKPHPKVRESDEE